jgi:hypothetical protein
MLLNWIVFLHIAGAFGLLLAHGASAAAAFALARERNIERVKVLLELSSNSLGIMYLSSLVLLLSGISAGFMIKAWGHGWIWTSLILLVVIYAVMGGMGSRIYGQVRKAVGLPYRGPGGKQPSAPASAEEIDRLLSKGKPMLLTVIGFGGLLLILWLMLFKPF